MHPGGQFSPHQGHTPMPRIAFLFPGQGAQSVGMGRELHAELPAVRALFDRAGEILGIDLAGLCFDGPAEALNATDVSQPALFVASLAALESLKATNPDVVPACEGAAGLSLGEYTALGLRGCDRIRSRAQAGAAARRSDAGRRRGNSERHGERARARREQGRRALCTRRAVRPALEGKLARAGQHRRLGRFRCPRTRRIDRRRAGRDEGDQAGGRGRVSFAAHEAGRPAARPVPGKTPISPPTHSRLLKRRRDPAPRARRHPGHAGLPGPRGRALGGVDAADDRRRIRHIL